MVSAVSALDDLTRAAHLPVHTEAGARAAIDALPWLGASLDDDRATGRFDAWGRSTVVDENTAATVIPQALFEALHERAEVAAAWPIGNAGLLHCYGYLLSRERTPYGLKRERWVDDGLAIACGLPSGAFHPWRAETTLLARASRAASALLATPAASASVEIEGRRTRMALGSSAGAAALVYAVAPTTGVEPLLVTMFPVAEASVPLAEFTTEPRLRWNAV